ARSLRAELIGQRDRLLGGVVRQTEHDEIDVGEHGLARGGVLAQRRIDARHLDARHARQPLADLKAGGAGLAVDKDARLARLAHWRYSDGSAALRERGLGSAPLAVNIAASSLSARGRLRCGYRRCRHPEAQSVLNALPERLRATEVERLAGHLVRARVDH